MASNRQKGVWLFIVSDSLLVLSTIIHKYFDTHPEIFRYGSGIPGDGTLSQLTLAYEMNIGVWWIGLHLLLAALISYELFSTTESRQKWCWLFISITFLGLFADEVGSIHERVFGLDWDLISIIFLIGGGAFIYAIWQLFDRKESRTSAVLILVGMGMMASAVPQEYLQHHVNWPSSLLGLRVGLEEGAEIFGALLCLIAAVRERVRVRTDFSWPDPWSRVVPNPFRMRGLHLAAVSGLVLHILASILYYDLNPSINIGSPIILYPYSIFVLIGAGYFWSSYYKKANTSIYPIVLSIFLLLSSLVSLYCTIPEASIKYYAYVGEISNTSKYITLYLTYIFAFTAVYLESKINKNVYIYGSSVSLIFIMMVIYFNGFTVAHYMFTGLFGFKIYLIIFQRTNLSMS